jgi:ribonuclease HII
LQATLLAMKRALLDLPVRPTRILIDGNCAPWLRDCFADCEVQTIVGGDASIRCISAASIIAKTHRDALMRSMDECYPGYGLGRHFGYATRAHLQALVRLGPSAIHRASFNPVRSWLRGAVPSGVLPRDFEWCDSEQAEAELEEAGDLEAEPLRAVGR